MSEPVRPELQPRGESSEDELRVLVVEDDPAIQLLIESWLVSAGHDAHVVGSGEEALEIIHEEFDLVLLDIGLPGIDGFEVLEEIRQDYEPSALPVIMLTGRQDSDDVIRALRLGANDYAKKPVDLQVLSGRMKAHARKRPGRGVLGGYRILGKLGSGGMGIVYRAAPVRGGDPVALKVLHRSLTFDDEYVTRFLREAQLASRVEHPNAVKILDTGKVDETYFLVMELVTGKDLYELSKDGPVPVELVLSIGRQIALALDALGDKGVMHRDVKPENILVTDEGVAKITDFGIAREIRPASRVTEPGVGMGSMAYVSPEQMSGAGDHRADIYALGSTLYFLLAGKDPYPSDRSPMVIHAQKLKSAPSLRAARPEVAPAIDEFIARMMAPREADRVQSFEEVVRALEAFERGMGRGARGRPVGSASATDGSPQPRSNVLAAVGIALLGFVLLAAVTVLAFYLG